MWLSAWVITSILSRGITKVLSSVKDIQGFKVVSSLEPTLGMPLYRM